MIAVVFWRPEGPYGWMSNWSDHPVTENAVVFPTTEHYFMYHKAVEFGDTVSAAMVLKAKSPRDAKRIGRNVAKFDAGVWESKSYDVMYRALKLKLEQHPTLVEELRKTVGAQIGEASPFDAVWGLGFPASHFRASDPMTWGSDTNKLGNLWMRLREET